MSLRLIRTEGEPPAVSLYRLPVSELREHGLSNLPASKAITSGEITE
jgi:hypothetical protein